MKIMLNNKLEVNKAEGCVCVGVENILRENSFKDLNFFCGKISEQDVYTQSRQVMCDNVLVIKKS
jgi:hypothetical protein